MDANEQYKEPSLKYKKFIYVINFIVLLLMIGFIQLYNLTTVAIFCAITIVIYCCLYSIGVVSSPGSFSKRLTIVNTVGNLMLAFSVFVLMSLVYSNRYDWRTNIRYRIKNDIRNQNQISDIMRHIALNTDVDSTVRKLFHVNSNYTIDDLPYAGSQPEGWDFDLMYEKEKGDYTVKMYEPTLHYLESRNKDGKNNIYSRPLFNNKYPKETATGVLKALDLPAANIKVVRESEVNYVIKNFQGKGLIRIVLTPLQPNSPQYIIRRVYVVTPS